MSAPFPATVLDIARQAEAHNTSAGMSGFLVFSSDYYLHYTEGPAGEVADLARRIRSDPRHQIDWQVAWTEDAPRLAGLPIGFFDADREKTRTAGGEVFRRGEDWSAADATQLAGVIVAVAREKYPRALSLCG